MKIPRSLALVFLLLLPALAQAWWNGDWKQRTQIILNTSPAGVETRESISSFAIPVRLHSGNFDFLSAKQDGSDLRFVSGDDKTPLKYWVERYDSVNELGVIWVQVPNVVPGTDKNIVYAYSGNDKASAETQDAALVFDSNTAAVFHFADKDGIATDQSGTIKAAAPNLIEPNGLIGPSAKLDGTPIGIAASDKLRAAAGAPFSLALWIKPDSVQGSLYRQGALQLSLDGGKLTAKLGSLVLAATSDIPPASWSQVALTLGSGKLSLYVNGAQSGQADLGVQATNIEGEISLGDAYQGLIDELEIASALRSPDWVKLAYAAQSADAKLVATKTQTPDSADAGEGGSTSNFGILVKSLTPDGWAVIGLLMVMFGVSIYVMVDKTLFVNKTQTANEQFLKQFRDAADVLALGSSYPKSSLFRLYTAGLRELTKRNVGHGGKPLSGASMDAVKASIDADMVRESYTLNGKMVMLTISIAGGPFLGLLGTVVGVMITFAAIAAAGDVNVNAIAPGIAAALLATVAGLAVAIPSLFGYNYLASRIKIISSDMQIFVDEFVTRVAEVYGAP